VAIHLKKLDEQVLVITGASSGIGLETAEQASKRGAKLVLAARSEETLKEVADRINGRGGEALAVACDVSDRQQVVRLANEAVRRFGRIDTWVNNAGLGMWGRLDQATDADVRRLFDVNFWGVVHGSLVALPHLKKRGGALINVGSEVSDAFMPLMGFYVATKYAVKGFTDALRVEVEVLDEAPVSVTLIQPGATDTPFPQHARNYTAKEAKLPEPVIEPKQVADAILRAAEHPTRDQPVGGKAFLNVAIAKVMPKLADYLSAHESTKLHYDEPPRKPEGSLHRPSEQVQDAGMVHGSGGKKG
jgi:short-subunit dehydrogenase